MLEDELHIAKLNHALENQIELNAELVAENEQLRNNPVGLTFDQQYLFDVVAQNVAIWRVRYDTLPDGMQEIIKAYDKAASGQEKEGDAIADNQGNPPSEE